MKVNKTKLLTHEMNRLKTSFRMSFSQKPLTNYYNDKILKG